MLTVFSGYVKGAIRVCHVNQAINHPPGTSCSKADQKHLTWVSFSRVQQHFL